MYKPIRILHCFGRTDMGGAETMIMNIYRNVDRNKIQFDFVTHTNDKCFYDNEILSLEGRIYHIPRYKIYNHFVYKKAWNELLRNNKNEWFALHAHILTTAGIYLKIAKKYGIITIAHSHTTSWGNILNKVKCISGFLLKLSSDFLFACSEAAGAWLFGKRACKQNIFYILRNAIDSKKFIYDQNKRIIKRNELHIDDKFVIGHIGNFIYYKNHDFIIEIFKAVHNINNNAFLILIGDGELRNYIEKKVHSYGLENDIYFAGARSDTPELLQTMDVFLFPSLHEGLGIVVIEAQASGLHTIVADTIPEEAYLTDLVESVPLNMSADRWAKRILKYVDGYERINTYEQIKAKGYDIAETAKWLEKFYLNKYEELSST